MIVESPSRHISSQPKVSRYRANAQPFDEVTVGDHAAKAGVTTGALYHHFENKLGLYTFVRRDVERRLLDRMEGAASAVEGRSASISAALLVGFDYAVRQDAQRLLGEPPTRTADDPLADLLTALSLPTPPPIGRILAAAWRAAVLSVADGVPAFQGRHALGALELQLGETAPKS